MSSRDGKTIHQEATSDLTTKREILAVLRKEYPVLTEYRPLKINIEVDLFERCSLSRSKIKQGLRYYLRSREYLRVLTKGGLRYDLDGNPVGSVTIDDQQQAIQTLAQREAEELERKQTQRTNTVNRSAA